MQPPPIESSNLKYPRIYPPPHSLLQYHLYAPEQPSSLKSLLKPNERSADQLFIPNNIREDLTKKNLSILQVFPLQVKLYQVLYKIILIWFHWTSIITIF